MNKKELLQPIETIPYDEPVGIVYEDGNVVTSFWYDEDFKKWYKHMAKRGYCKPKYWFNLGDLQKAFVEV